MKFFPHGQWMHGNTELARMLRGEDGLIYFERTVHSVERNLRLLPDGAEIVEGVSYSVRKGVSDSGVRAEVGDNPHDAQTERNGAHGASDRVRIRDSGPD